jgi:hypothetical protein
MSGRPLVIQGIPNHMNAIANTPAASHQRIPGTRNQAQIMNSPRKGHISGRPSELSTPRKSVHRYRPSMNMSIAASTNVTIIGSDCALRM